MVWHYRVGTWKMWNCMRNRLEGDAAQYKRSMNRDVLRYPNEWRCDGVNLFQQIPPASCHQKSTNSVLVSIHASHETQQKHHGFAKVDDKISVDWKQTDWVLDGSLTRFGDHQSRGSQLHYKRTSKTWSLTSWPCKYCSSYSRTRTTCQCTLDRWDVFGPKMR